MPTDQHEKRLQDITGWTRTAKENLPSINDGRVSVDRIARMSALLDRLHDAAIRLRTRMIEERRQRAA